MNHAPGIVCLIGMLMATAMGAMGCASKQPDRIGVEEARAMFAARGVQPGQALPTLSLVDLNGNPVNLAAIQAGKPMVLVTASLTCNVARRQQQEVDAIAERFGNAITVITIYTIDAHPKGDPCPYTGKEWVPADNERDAVLVKQPTTLHERLAVARQYRDRFSNRATVLVDTVDNASWLALGQAPNLGLLVDEQGVVKIRQGWFDAKEMNAALETRWLGDAPSGRLGKLPLQPLQPAPSRANRLADLITGTYGDALEQRNVTTRSSHRVGSTIQRC